MGSAYVSLIIGGVPVTALVDCGSTGSLIHPNLLDKISKLRPVEFIEIKEPLKLADGALFALNVFQVLPGTEGFARAGNHDDAYFRVFAHLLERVNELEAEVVVERVVAVGAVEGDGGNAVFEFVEEDIGHISICLVFENQRNLLKL